MGLEILGLSAKKRIRQKWQSCENLKSLTLSLPKCNGRVRNSNSFMDSTVNSHEKFILMSLPTTKSFYKLMTTLLAHCKYFLQSLCEKIECLLTSGEKVFLSQRFRDLRRLFPTKNIFYFPGKPNFNIGC